MNAMELLDSGTATLAVVRDGAVVLQKNGRGIAPALALYDERPALLQGAEVYDTIVGKAAAAIYVLGGVRAVHAHTMSRAAQELLAAHGVRTSCRTLAEALINRAGTGLCPFEQAVLPIREAEACLPVIRQTLARLRAGASAGA